MKKILAFLAKIKASPETAQQWAHFSLPVITQLIFAYKLHWPTFPLVMFWIAFGLLVEILFDPIEEHDPFWPKGFRDFCFYTAGALAGFLVTL